MAEHYGPIEFGDKEFDQQTEPRALEEPFEPEFDSLPSPSGGAEPGKMGPLARQQNKKFEAEMKKKIRELDRVLEQIGEIQEELQGFD